MKVYGRRWRVQVGTLDTTLLDVKFKVNRSLYSRAGTCELEIANLSPDHRHELVTARRYHTFVEVQAGYIDGMSLLFRGDLRKAIPSRDGTDWTVKVTAGDGEHAIRTARVSRSFSPGTSVGAVVQHIAETMGVGIGNAREALRGARLGEGESVFPEGTVLYGSAAAELTRLCAAARLTWTVQDGNLQVLPLGGALERTALVLGPDTGLIGSPEIVNRRTVNVKALLIPGLVPGQQVILNSAIVTGTCRITEAEYAGDTEGPDWNASLVLHRPLPPLIPSGTTGA